MGKPFSPDAIDLFDDMPAVLNSIVSNSCYVMLRGLIGIYLPLAHPIIAIYFLLAARQKTIIVSFAIPVVHLGFDCRTHCGRSYRMQASRG